MSYETEYEIYTPTRKPSSAYERRVQRIMDSTGGTPQAMARYIDALHIAVILLTAGCILLATVGTLAVCDLRGIVAEMEVGK